MSFVKNLLNKLATSLHRSAIDAQDLGDRGRVRAKTVVFYAVSAFGVFVFFPLAVERLLEWRDIGPDVQFPKSAWLYHYAASPARCDWTARGQGCFASPEDPTLWSSPVHNTEKRHADRVRQMQGREFWMGALIANETLHRAAAVRANEFVIGWIRATYRVWVDGEYIKGGSRVDTEPLVLTIPMSRMLESRPLRIAIQIYHDAEHPRVDVLNSSTGEGFYTSPRIHIYHSFASFWAKARPFALLTVNLFIASLFFFFWNLRQTNQEYFYMAMYALIAGLHQARYLDMIFIGLSPRTLFGIDVVFNIFDGTFAMLLGFAFARMRSSIFSWTIGAAVALSGVSLFFLRDSHSLFRFNLWFIQYVTPWFYAFGTLSCWIQAAYIYSTRSTRAWLPQRAQNLLWFGIGLGALGVVIVARESTLSHQISWHRFAHVSLVFYLATLIFNDIRTRELLVTKAPVSEYHRRAVLPDSVNGVALVVDLKASEAFYKQKASRPGADDLVAIWRSHCYWVISSLGGIVLMKKGDEMIAFFDQEKCPDPVRVALQVCDEMVAVSRQLENQFQNQELMPPGSKGFHFRGALSPGAVRPTWEEVGRAREPYWEEAGGTTPLVAISRLLEFERKAPATSDSVSLVVLADAVAATLQGVTLECRGQKMTDKHGTEYAVAIYKPCPKEESAPLASIRRVA